MNKARQREFEIELGGLQYYGLDDYKRLFLRRKWTIVFVMLTVALGAAVFAYFIKNSYQAKTTIMIDPGKVPESYVRSTATLSATERLSLLQQQILSNVSLSQVIDELGLYSDLKKRKTPDEVLLEMRKDVHLEPLYLEGGRANELAAFTISYRSESPTTAARVANRLASLFIDENLKSREEQVLGTAEFIDRELDKTRQEMVEKERKLDDLRSRHASELPESQNAHVQAMATLQLELRAEMDAVSRAQQQKMYLQSMVANNPAVVDLDSSDAAVADGTSGLREQLSRLQARQDQLRTRYGPDYPDVVKGQQEIERLEQQIKKLAASAPASAAPLPPTVLKQRNPVIESQIAALNDQMAQHAKREDELKSEIAYHQSMLDKAPAISQEVMGLTRDYMEAEDNYKRLMDQKFSADVSSDMERRQKGERFLILEPAQPPTRPFEPNRPLIDALALCGGLGLGVLLAVLLEVLDGTVKTAREATEGLDAPIFGEIPWIGTVAGKRRSRLRALMAAGGNTLLAFLYLMVCAVSLKK